MPNVAVRKIGKDKPAATMKELSETFDQIRDRAFELFERRGGAHGQDTNDWVQAEKELFWVPQAEIRETDSEVTIEVGVPGFAAKDIQVTVQPGEILVRGNTEKFIEKKEGAVSFSEFGEKSLYRRFEVTPAIDVDRTTAAVENGLLTISAVKTTADKTREATA